MVTVVDKLATECVDKGGFSGAWDAGNADSVSVAGGVERGEESASFFAVFWFAGLTPGDGTSEVPTRPLLDSVGVAGYVNHLFSVGQLLTQATNQFPCSVHDDGSWWVDRVGAVTAEFFEVLFGDDSADNNHDVFGIECV